MRLRERFGAMKHWSWGWIIGIIIAGVILLLLYFNPYPGGY